MIRHRRILAGCLAVLLLSGCATTHPAAATPLPYPHISRGQPNGLVDGLGNILGLPAKVLLLSWKINNHKISPETERGLVDFLTESSPPEALQDARFRLNEYAPIDDLKRLATNRHVAWPYRLVLGLPVTLVFEVLLPGRLFGGDHYNAFTNTVAIYSDEPSVALHEAGHAEDFSEQRFKGTYATIRMIPGIDLIQEFTASEKAIDYYIRLKDRPAELRAYKLLYPAYSTYLGSYLIPFGNFAGAAVGHVWGRMKARSRAKYYRILDAASSAHRSVSSNAPPSPIAPPTPIPAVDTP